MNIVLFCFIMAFYTNSIAQVVLKGPDTTSLACIQADIASPPKIQDFDSLKSFGGWEFKNIRDTTIVYFLFEPSFSKSMVVLGQETNGKFELQAVLEDSDIKEDAIDVNNFLDSIKIENLNTLERNMLNCEMTYTLADGTLIQFLRFDKGWWVISEWDYRDDYDSKYHSLINSRIMEIYVELKSRMKSVSKKQ